MTNESIECLNEKISNLELEISKAFQEIKFIQDKIQPYRDELYELLEKRDTLVIKNKDPQEIDIELILEGNPRSTARHKEQSKQLQRIGLSRDGYYRETGQTALRIALRKYNNTVTEKAYKGLYLLLPHLLPYTKDSISRRVDILEHTLSEYASYSLHILGNSAESRCRIMTCDRFVELEFNNLKDALDYIQENLFYQEE